MARLARSGQFIARCQFAGAVINISVLFVVGDRLAANGTLDRRQVIILNRIIVRRSGRPFIAMAVALTYALACNFAYFYRLIVSKPLVRWSYSLGCLALGIADFEGYPLRLQTLRLPLLLCIAVLVGKGGGQHSLSPALSR